MKNFKNKYLALSALVVMLIGCATTNPYTKIYEALDKDYASGKLTTFEYQYLRQKVQLDEIAYQKQQSANRKLIFYQTLNNMQTAQQQTETYPSSPYPSRPVMIGGGQTYIYDTSGNVIGVMPKQ